MPARLDPHPNAIESLYYPISIPARSDSHVGVVGKFEGVLQRLEGLGTARNHLTQFRYGSYNELPSIATTVGSVDSITPHACTCAAGGKWVCWVLVLGY